MRLFGCDHCGAEVRVTTLINRRPEGWSSIRGDTAVSEQGTRRSVDVAKFAYELCADCTGKFHDFFKVTE